MHTNIHCTTYIHSCIHKHALYYNKYHYKTTQDRSYIDTPVHTHTCIHAYIHTSIHTYVHPCIRTYSHYTTLPQLTLPYIHHCILCYTIYMMMYTYIYIHTYIHIRICLPCWKLHRTSISLSLCLPFFLLVCICTYIYIYTQRRFADSMWALLRWASRRPLGQPITLAT